MQILPSHPSRFTLLSPFSLLLSPLSLPLLFFFSAPSSQTTRPGKSLVRLAEPSSPQLFRQTITINQFFSPSIHQTFFCASSGSPLGDWLDLMSDHNVQKVFPPLRISLTSPLLSYLCCILPEKKKIEMSRHKT